ncbi:MAG TPA: PDZ domain-containing protein [Planctomycetota bacterium]|nr:PDZ domain-containing protein [Planctomycetota bacterium]
MLPVIPTRVALAALLLQPLAAQQSDIKAQIDYAKSKVYPALVNISVVSKSYEGGRTVRRPSAGSGTVVSPAGHVITNYHVVEDAERVTCTLPTGEAIVAKVLAEDPALDFAVLELDLLKRRNPNVALPFATLGDSSTVAVGDYVLVVGNPLALSSSMTLGIVSNTRRVFTDFLGNEADDLDIGGQKTGMFTLWIQTDALILPGNSGGAMVNMRGEIVGMNTRGGGGLGFATPSNLLSKSLNQIMTFGEVRRGWMGIDVKPVADPAHRGALVSNVVPGSPADEAGLVPGDRVTSIDGHAVQCQFIDELPLVYGAIADLAPGATVQVGLEGGKTVSVRVARWQNFLADEREFRGLGVTVRNVTPLLAVARGWPNSDGVLITGIRPGKPLESARPDLAGGDVITSLDGKPVKTLADVEATFANAKPGSRLAFGVRRGRQDIVSALTIEEPVERKGGTTLPRPWIGVQTQVLMPDVATALGMAGQKGLRVTRVLADTRAAASGLQVGDILTALGDETLDSHRPQDAGDLENLLHDFAVDQKVVLKVRRGDQELSIDIQLEASRLVVGQPAKASDDFFELKVREIVFSDRVDENWPEGTQGAVVTDSANGGWAAMAGLRTGDLIQRIDSVSIATPADVTRALDGARAERRAIIQILVRRGTRTTFVIVEPTYPK